MFLECAVSDWLPSKNYYYSIRTNKISDNINDLIEAGYINFHAEGLCNYLDYGYSVFGQTIIDEIKILEPNMKVYHDQDGKLVIEHLKDPFDDLLNVVTSPEDALDILGECINKWVDSQNDRIILPLSGGFDSRLIISLIDNKDKISAFTYGISDNQEESFEVVYAKTIANKFSVNWKQIILDEYSGLIDEWIDLFGVTSHAHGMYHIEFYKKIKEIIGSQGNVISGILGDVYAGNWRFEHINKSSDLKKLVVSHGLNADSAYCTYKNNHEIENAFYEENKEKLEDENWRVLTAARMKSSLLTYLLKVPESVGFKSWSPFLDINVVSKMLTLPWEEKNKRKWQVEYFKKKDLLVGEWGLQCTRENVLDRKEYRKFEFVKLDYSILGNLIKKDYLCKINDCIDNGNILMENHEKELNAWFTIYPIQKMLKKYA